MCVDTGHRSAISPKIGALFQYTLHACMCVEGMWGAGVSHTAVQPLAGGATFLLASWMGQSHTHTHMHFDSTCQPVIRTYMPERIYFYFIFFLPFSAHADHCQTVFIITQQDLTGGVT